MLRRLRLKKTFQVIILTLIAAMALYTPGIRAAASQDIKYQNSDAVPQDIQYENDEAKNDALILDWADVLTDTEEDELLEHMAAITDYGNAVFYTLDENPEEDAEQACVYKYTELYGESDGVCFTIDFESREFYISSFGEFSFMIEDGAVDRIADNCAGYATDGEYYTCAAYVFDEYLASLNVSDKNSDEETTEDTAAPVKEASAPVVNKNPETNYEVRIIDDAGLLSENEKKQDCRGSPAQGA